MVQKPDITKIRDININGIIIKAKNIERASKYIEITGNDLIDYLSILHLENLRNIVSTKKYSIDEIKHLLPESYLCDIVWTINVRSLRNFLQLRLSKSAHFKIQELAKLVYEAIPEQHKFLYKDIIDDNRNV